MELRADKQASEMQTADNPLLTYSPAHVAVLLRRYDSLQTRDSTMRRRKMKKATRGSAQRIAITLGEKGAKAVSITGLIIAYGINSLATTLSNSTYTSAPVVHFPGSSGWGEEDCSKTADMSARLDSERGQWL
jgi:hypothetical protein